MKTTVTINGITQEIELTQGQLKLFEKPMTGWERVDKGCRYYVARCANTTEVVEVYENDDKYDSVRYVNGFYSNTPEHCTRQFKIDSLRRRMQRFADMHYPDLEWNNKNSHFYIHIQYELAELEINWDWMNNYKDPFQVYFNSLESAEKAIELFGAEILELYK